jgi:hypothetical protein
MFGPDSVDRRLFGHIPLVDGTVFMTALFAAIEFPVHLGRHPAHAQGDRFRLQGIPPAAAAVQGTIERRNTHVGTRGKRSGRKRAVRGR